MAAALVYGERVELPEGWLPVIGECVKPGDRLMMNVGDVMDVRWKDAEKAKKVGIRTANAMVVIRRDPSVMS